tara:strand:+ start:4987 stop:5805 length:819 start_codon:yes stop_codon:yes gene_type:complete
MKSSSRKITSRFGNKIFVRSWTPNKSNQALLMVHGLGEHSGRYEVFSKYLKNEKLSLYAFDLPGHGKTYGRKGHIKKFDEYLDSLEDVLIHIRKENLDIPIKLFGHSLGGLISLSFLINRESKEIDSAIISSPWIKLGLEVPKYLIEIQKVLVNIIPGFRLNNRINTNDLTKDNKINTKYINDQLVHDRISFKLYSEINNQINLVVERCDRIKLKVLLYHGTEDKIISCESIKILSSKIKNSNMVFFKEVYHEPHNDLEKKEVFKKIIKFLN